MNQKKIKNPETQVPKTPEMNDRDYINDLLATEKYMTASYCTALNEFSHDALYHEVLGIFTETQNCQRELYNLMFKKGWYGVEAADQQQLQQTYEQFSGYTNQFPHH
ncbi:spore coat protein [Priestia koreensis]|uniref:Spore coat protein n=1 Tax=Priestia koreensis TaxID=284581 RepID=A0A0M0KE93_9BACI|nr:spore coat protein [Priestia koreensis]KOO37109.1 hypothetical protein AMD01_21715 [Priestia koreensis]